jgi:hypothetical protein
MKNIGHPERRWNVRKKVALEISLFRDEEKLLHTQTDNVSMGGAFIRKVPQPFRIDQTLTIVFTLQTQQGLSHHRLPARITRSTEQGTALAFSDYELQTVHLMRETLYDNPLDF